jgi:cellulose synthase/poly-beta-1,6-N-acetylglucosamine synthase-like glycosyltransferase
VLSILIPTYNHNCCPLVDSLGKQIIKSGKECEIICIDDASVKVFSEIDAKLKEFSFFTHIKLNKNVGRSRIRNLLASKAQYNWILFLDADTLPTHPKFIENYINIIESNPKKYIYSGGLAYRKKDYKKKNSLRYKYGIKRESIDAEKRNRNPYTSLLMSNTLLKKEIFDKTGFNDKITLYGHEDAVFSFDLYGAGFSVKHIDNKVYHTGLESNDVFIEKTKVAVKNLWYLYMQSLIHPEMNRLLKSYTRVKKWGISSVFSLLYSTFHSKIEEKLKQENPSLRLFDIYRLSYLCHVSNLEN